MLPGFHICCLRHFVLFGLALYPFHIRLTGSWNDKIGKGSVLLFFLYKHFCYGFIFLVQWKCSLSFMDNVLDHKIHTGLRFVDQDTGDLQPCQLCLRLCVCQQQSVRVAAGVWVEPVILRDKTPPNIGHRACHPKMRLIHSVQWWRWRSWIIIVSLTWIYLFRAPSHTQAQALSPHALRESA